MATWTSAAQPFETCCQDWEPTWSAKTTAAADWTARAILESATCWRLRQKPAPPLGGHPKRYPCATLHRSHTVPAGCCRRNRCPTPPLHTRSGACIHTKACVNKKRVGVQNERRRTATACKGTYPVVVHHVHHASRHDRPARESAGRAATGGHGLCRGVHNVHAPVGALHGGEHQELCNAGEGPRYCKRTSTATPQCHAPTHLHPPGGTTTPAPSSPAPNSTAASPSPR